MKKRSGIALLITLGFIALITAVILSTLTILQDTNKATVTVKNLAQTQLVIQNFKRLLDTATKDVKDPESLELLLDSIPPTIPSDDGKFILDIQINSLHRRININAMLDHNTTPRVMKEPYQRFIRNMLRSYYVQDPDTMLHLIQDSLDTDDISGGDGTELKLVEADFHEGHISSLQSLRKLADVYASQTKDSSIYTVEWEKYFSFGPDENETLLDCNRFEPYDVNNIQERSLPKSLEWKFPPNGEGFDYNCTKGNDLETIKGYTIGSYNSKQNYFLEIAVQYELEGQKGAFTALYNLKDKTLREISIKPAI